MAFSQLPPEVLGLIVRHLASQDKLAPYSTISHAFRRAIEDHLFSELSFSSLDLLTLASILDSYADRKAAIGKIIFAVVLPTYTDQECAYFETAQDRDANDRVFTEAIARLFSILETCDSFAGPTEKTTVATNQAAVSVSTADHVKSNDVYVNNLRPIALYLGHAYAPMDLGYRDLEKVEADRNACELNKRKDLFQHRYEHSYINMPPAQSLPRLYRVSALHVDGTSHRFVAPAVAAKLVSRLPNVGTIKWTLCDRERKYRELRTELRQSFGQALMSLHLPKASSLDLELVHDPSANEAHSNYDVRAENELLMDSFSSLLGQFLRTTNLVKINLGGPICIGPEIFWVGEQSAQGSTVWPNLQEFLVTLSLVRPDGGWYCDRAPTGWDSEDSEDEEHQATYVRMAAWRGDDIYAPSDDSESSGFDSDDSFFEPTGRPPDAYNESRERWRQGDSPVRSFRTLPSPQLEKLFEAAARAVPHMRALRTFAVGADIQSCARTGHERQVCEFTYAAAGVSNWMDRQEGDAHSRRVIWVGPKEWRPGEALEKAWKTTLGEAGLTRYEEW